MTESVTEFLSSDGKTVKFGNHKSGFLGDLRFAADLYTVDVVGSSPSSPTYQRIGTQMDAPRVGHPLFATRRLNLPFNLGNAIGEVGLLAHERLGLRLQFFESVNKLAQCRRRYGVKPAAICAAVARINRLDVAERFLILLASAMRALHGQTRQHRRARTGRRRD